MTNLYRQNNRSHGLRRIVAATALVGLLFIGDLLSHGAIRTLVRSGVASTQYAAHRIWNAVDHLGVFAARASLARENADLKIQLQDLQLKAAAFDALSAQDQELRALAHVAAAHPRGVTASILSPFFSSPFGTFTIGAGAADGISVGDTVLMSAETGDAGSFVIGTIQETGAHTALVSEVFSPKERTQVRLNGSESTLEEGNVNGGHLQIPRGISVAVGDIVTSPAYGNRPVGVVRSVVSDPSQPYSHVYVSLPVSPAARQFVYVEKP